jgi:hypothetical protein
MAELNQDSPFPEKFTCSAAGQEESYNRCDADVEDGILLSSDNATEESDNEVTY